MRSTARARTSCIACLLLVIATSAGGVTHVVDLAGGGDYLTIQEGVTATGEGDTVLVASGVYTGAMNRSLDFGGKNFVLMSQDGPESTVIDCEGASRGVLFQSGEGSTALFVGFTVTNGSDFYGGAVYCVGSSPTITDCVFTNNTASLTGGAMLIVANSSPTVTDCVFEENTAHDASGSGGGAVTCADCTPVVTHCCVVENVGGDSLCGDYHDNLFVDPLFCHPEVGDYGLHDDSPCLPGYNPWGEQIGATGPGSCGTGVAEESTELERALVLYSLAPNPFSRSTVISCAVPRGAGEVEVSIYSAAGRRVRTLVDRGAGDLRRLVWDGRDEHGQDVAAGVYLIRAATGMEIASGKLVMVR